MKTIEDIVSEFEERFVDKNLDTAESWDALKSFLAKVYTAARLATLSDLEGRLLEKNHVRDGVNIDHGKDEYWGCCDCYEDEWQNTYRSAVIALIEEMRGEV